QPGVGRDPGGELGEFADGCEQAARFVVGAGCLAQQVQRRLKFLVDQQMRIPSGQEIIRPPELNHTVLYGRHETVADSAARVQGYYLWRAGDEPLMGETVDFIDRGLRQSAVEFG